MSVFGNDYASYYDLFYADKDYVAEAAFVRDVIERHRPNARIRSGARMWERTPRRGICARRPLCDRCRPQRRHDRKGPR